MSCKPLCARVPPLLDNPTRNETEIWRYVATLAHVCGDAALCIAPPLLDDPTPCEIAFTQWLATMQNSLCGKQTLCQYVPPLLDPGCSPNLKRLEFPVLDYLNPGPGSGGSGGNSQPSLPFVPPPCPVDPLVPVSRVGSQSLSSTGIPWNEDEFTSSFGNFIPSPPPETLKMSDSIILSHVPIDFRCHHIITDPPGVNFANIAHTGFLSFGGIGGGPINWLPNQEITVGSAPFDGAATRTGEGPRTFTGILAVRQGGIRTNYTGYAIGKMGSDYLSFYSIPASQGILVRLRNVDLDDDFRSQDVTVLTTFTHGGATLTLRGMKIEGQKITVDVLPFGTLVFTDTFGIISGPKGPGAIMAADVNNMHTQTSGALGDGSVGNWSGIAGVCLKDLGL